MTTPENPPDKSDIFFYRICCPVACLGLVGLNFAILDYFLLNDHWKESGYYMWIIADILVLCLFLAAFIKSYQRFTGDLPLSYISWLFFSCFLSAKVFVIYTSKDIARKRVVGCNFLGINILETGISMGAFIFETFARSHHDISGKKLTNDLLQHIVYNTYIDILDTTQFLDTLSKNINTSVGGADIDLLNTTQFLGACSNNTGRYELYKTSQAITAVNYILPTVAIYLLARSRFEKIPEECQLIYMAIYYLIINVPLFIVRMIMWLQNGDEISVFIGKNAMAIVQSVKAAYVYTFYRKLSNCVKKKAESGNFEMIAGSSGPSNP